MIKVLYFGTIRNSAFGRTQFADGFVSNIEKKEPPHLWGSPLVPPPRKRNKQQKAPSLWGFPLVSRQKATTKTRGFPSVSRKKHVAFLRFPEKKKKKHAAFLWFPGEEKQKTHKHVAFLRFPEKTDATTRGFPSVSRKKHVAFLRFPEEKKKTRGFPLVSRGRKTKKRTNTWRSFGFPKKQTQQHVAFLWFPGKKRKENIQNTRGFPLVSRKKNNSQTQTWPQEVLEKSGLADLLANAEDFEAMLRRYGAMKTAFETHGAAACSVFPGAPAMSGFGFSLGPPRAFARPCHVGFFGFSWFSVFSGLFPRFVFCFLLFSPFFWFLFGFSLPCPVP